jgi:hypothetical protein
VSPRIKSERKHGLIPNLVAGLKAGLILLALAACEKPLDEPWAPCPDTNVVAEVGARLAKSAMTCQPPPWPTWTREPPAAYRFTFSRQCFCLPEDVGPFVVTIENGAVLSARRRVSGGDTAAAGSLQSYALDSIWAQANRALAEPYTHAFIRYDSVWGFPDSFFVDKVMIMADDEYGFTVRDFTILPATSDSATR